MRPDKDLNGHDGVHDHHQGRNDVGADEGEAATHEIEDHQHANVVEKEADQSADVHEIQTLDGIDDHRVKTLRAEIDLTIGQPLDQIIEIQAHQPEFLVEVLDQIPDPVHTLYPPSTSNLSDKILALIFWLSNFNDRKSNCKKASPPLDSSASSYGVRRGDHYLVASAKRAATILMAKAATTQPRISPKAW